MNKTLTITIILLAGFFFFCFEAKSAVCDITGGTRYQGCVIPKIRWTDGLGRYYEDKYAASQGALQDILQNHCPDCNYGIKTAPFSYVPDTNKCDESPVVVSEYYTDFQVVSGGNLSFTVWAHGQTPSKRCEGTKQKYHISKAGNVQAVAICPENYSLLREENLATEPFGYVCAPPTDGIYRPSLCTDQSNEGCDTAGNPVRLSDRSKIDYKQDLTTGGPFPIVWSRVYTSVAGWRFPQLKNGTASTVGNQSNLVMDRGDGSFLETQKDAQGQWQPTFSSVASRNRILSRITPWEENGKGKGFIVSNRHGEKEHFNLLGQLSILKNAQGQRHHYTYDQQSRLKRIEDDFGNFLVISYAHNEGRTTQLIQHPTIDSSGNPSSQNFIVEASSLAPQSSINLIESVTNGTDTVGYGWTFAQNNGARWRHNLTEVVNPDGTVITYTYGETVAGLTGYKYEMTGIYDETGQRAATYKQSNGIVWAEWHGGDASSPTSAGAYNQLSFNSNSVTDGLGKTFGFTSNASLRKITGYTKDCSWCTGLVAKNVVYDAYGNPTSITDFNGNIEKRTYDTSRGLPLTLTRAFGTPLEKTTTVTWHPEWPTPLSISEPIEVNHQSHTRTTNYTYLGDRALPLHKTVTASSGEPNRIWTYTYNSEGLLETSTDPAGMVTRHSYSSHGNLAAVVVADGTSLARTTTLENYTPEGLPGKVIDANGVANQVTWNERSQPVEMSASSTNGQARTQKMEYWPNGLLKKTTYVDGTSVELEYNAARQVIEARRRGTDSSMVARAVFERDTMSQTTAVFLYNHQGEMVQKDAYQYDALNRLNQATGAQNQSEIFAYNAQGDQVSVTSPLNSTTTAAWDSLGRVKTITDAANAVFSLDYTVGGKIKLAHDAKGVHTSYAYNGFGDLTEVASQDRGTWSFGYNPAGQHVQTTDPRGVVTTLTRDLLGRATTLTFHPPATATAGLEPEVSPQAFGYDACPYGSGRLCSIEDSSGTTSYVYNAWGDRIGKAWTGKANGPAAGVTLSVGYGYDSTKGRMTSITFPSGRTQQISYGTDGQPHGLAYGGQAVVANINWTPMGKVAGWAWPQAVGWSGTHSQVSFSYDLDGRPVEIQDLDDRSLVWDVGDRLVGVNDANNADHSQIYGYDPLDRLTSAEIGIWDGAIGFTYDAVGNRTSTSDLTDGNAWQYTYGLTHNRLVSQKPVTGGVAGTAFTASYDAMGNLVSDGIGLQLSYDATGRLVRGSKGPQEMTAAYNALGQRTTKTSGSQTRVYAVDEAGRPLGVYIVDAAQPNGFRTEEEYVHLDGWRPVAVLRPDPNTGMDNPKIFPILTDHLGTPRKVLDGDTGEVRWSWDAKQPFGHDLPNETPTAGQAAFTFDLRFPGQRVDEETGLFHNGFRDYHSGLGRYVQSDPLGLKAGWNTFAYTDSSPLLRMDPRGLDWFRDWNDTQSPYPVGRRNHPIVPPGGPISKFIEHCVPAGKTFGEIHDQRVDILTKGGVPDWKANLPSMPGAYMDAVTKEDQRMWAKVEQWWWNLFEFDKPHGEKP